MCVCGEAYKDDGFMELSGKQFGFKNLSATGFRLQSAARSNFFRNDTFVQKLVIYRRTLSWTPEHGEHILISLRTCSVDHAQWDSLLRWVLHRFKPNRSSLLHGLDFCQCEVHQAASRER